MRMRRKIIVMSREDASKTKLQQARLQKGWTQRVLIELIDNKIFDLQESQEEPEEFKRWLRKHKGLNPKTLIHWENGIRPPKLNYQRILCLVFDQSPEDLGFISSSQQGNQPEETPQGTPVLLTEKSTSSFVEISEHGHTLQ